MSSNQPNVVRLYIPRGPRVGWEELTQRRVLFAAYWLIDRTKQSPIAAVQSIGACCKNCSTPAEVNSALTELVRVGLLEQHSNGFTLTDRGRQAAGEIPITNVISLELPGLDLWNGPLE